jgi:hypothetical protein
MKQVGTKDWQEVFAANPGAVEGYLGSVGRARNDLKHQLLTSHLDKLSDFAREVRDVYELGGDMGAKVDKIAGASKGAKDEIESALKTASIRNEAKKILATKTGRGLAQVAQLEQKIRAALGKDVPEAAVETLGPEAGSRVAQLSHMERAAKDVTRQVARSMDALVAKLKETPKLAVPTGVKAYHEIELAPREKRTKHASGQENPYDARLSELTNLVQNPELLQQRLAATFGDLPQFAPRVATELQFAVQQALNYMYSQAPKNPYMAATVDLRRAWKPSATELVSFERTIRAIHDPVGVIRRLRGTATSARRPQMRYGPSIPRSMRRWSLISFRKLPRPKASRCSAASSSRTFLGVSLDSLTDPKTTATFQQMYAEAAQQAAPPARPTQSPRHYRAHQAATPLQRIAEEG